jgi:hypothetical protein
MDRAENLTFPVTAASALESLNLLGAVAMYYIVIHEDIGADNPP